MGVTILVAVDIVEGRVVRLRRGEMGEQTVYGDDPAKTALGWERAGAEWLHVVDVEGAVRGEPRNAGAIDEILAAVSIPVQVGGGVRTLKEIGGRLEGGAARVCLGTKALDESFLAAALAEFGEGLVATVEARAGQVRVAGWLEGAAAGVLETVKRLEEAGVSRIMFTDIDRDGTLSGPNFEAIEQVVEAAGIPVIAAGGVDGESSVRRLAGLAGRGLEGIVIGKALYSGALSLEGAQRATAEA